MVQGDGTNDCLLGCSRSTGVLDGNEMSDSGINTPETWTKISFVRELGDNMEALVDFFLDIFQKIS
jgi:hypothetical protein